MTRQRNLREHEVKRIVLFRALKLGDLLCTVPAFRALRHAFQDAQISLVGLPWAVEFVKQYRCFLDDFIEFPGFPGLPEMQPRLKDIPPFIERMQRENIDLCIQMHGSGNITNSIVSLFSSKNTAGFYQPNMFRPNEDLFFEYPAEESEVMIYLRLMEQLGIPSRGTHLEFPLTTDDRKAAQTILDNYVLQSGAYVVLHPGSSSSRRWPAEYFADVGMKFIRQGIKVVITGTASERDLANQVNLIMNSKAVNLAGQTNLGALGGILSKARLLICNDTGVSHLADALTVPSIVLFTSSDANRWAPLDQQRHQPVLQADHVSPQSVFQMAEKMLGCNYSID